MSSWRWLSQVTWDGCPCVKVGRITRTAFLSFGVCIFCFEFVMHVSLLKLLRPLSKSIGMVVTREGVLLTVKYIISYEVKIEKLHINMCARYYI